MEMSYADEIDVREAELERDLASALQAVQALQAERDTLKSAYENVKEELLSHAAALQTARQDALQQGELRLRAQRQLAVVEGQLRDTQVQVEQLEREKGAWEAQRESMVADLTSVRDEVISSSSHGDISTTSQLALVPVASQGQSSQLQANRAGQQGSPAIAVLQSQVRELQACADELQRQLSDCQAARVSDAQAHAAHIKDIQLQHSEDSAQLRTAFAQLKAARDASASGLGSAGQGALAELHARLDSTEEARRALQVQLAAVRHERDEAVAKGAASTARHAEEAARLQGELLTALSTRESCERACSLAQAQAEGLKEEAGRLRAAVAHAEGKLKEEQVISSAMPSILQHELAMLRSELSEERGAREQERASTQAQLIEQGQTIARLQAQVASTEQSCSLRIVEEERKVSSERGRAEQFALRVQELEGQVATLLGDITTALAQGGVTGSMLDVSRADASMLDVSRSGPRRSSLSAVLQAHGQGMFLGGVAPLSAVKPAPPPGRLNQSALLSTSYVGGREGRAGLGSWMDVSHVTALARAVVRAEDEQAVSLAQSQTQALVAQGEASALRRTCDDLRTQLSSAQSELSRAQQQLVEARRQGDRAAGQAQEAEMKAAIAMAQSSHAEDALEEARQRCRALEDREVPLRATVLGLQQGAGAAVAQETAALQHECSRLEEELGDARAELATARAKASKYKSQLLQLYELHKEAKAALVSAHGARAHAERAHQEDISRLLKHQAALGEGKEAVLQSHPAM